MVVVSYSGKEINSKLVYYGAGLSGKTTNLESIYEAVPDTSRGKMVSMKTQSDRTLFFDLLPLNLGEIMGFKTRFLLYTVPGQVFYNATRKLVLKGADAIVFVADSEIGKMDENKDSLVNLRNNLAEYGVKLEDIPWVLQYNKRDLENRYSIEELQKALNPNGTVPYFEAVASQGKGVFETFRGISHMLLEKVAKDLRRTPLGGARKPEPGGRPDTPGSIVTTSPYGKPPSDSPTGTLSSSPFGRPAAPPAGAAKPVSKPTPPSFGRVSLPTGRPAPDAANPAGEMPEIVVEDTADAPEAVIEAAPIEDETSFRPDPVRPPPSGELRTPRLSPMPRRQPSSDEMRRPTPAPRIEPARRPVEPPVHRTTPPERTMPERAMPERAIPSRVEPSRNDGRMSPQEAVIPLVLPPGSGTREILIRIIVTEGDRAA